MVSISCGSCLALRDSSKPLSQSLGASLKLHLCKTSLSHGTLLVEVVVHAHIPPSLQDVSPLFSLPRLEELSFSDPAHGPNPFSTLCNYSTHLLYHLPQLKRLDGRDVTHPHLRNVIQVHQWCVPLYRQRGLWQFNVNPLVPKSRDSSQSVFVPHCAHYCNAMVFPSRFVWWKWALSMEHNGYIVLDGMILYSTYIK